MPKKRLFFAACLILALVSACTLQREYRDQQDDPFENRQQVDAKNKKIVEMTQHLQEAERDRNQCLEKLERDRNQCLEKLSDLQTRYGVLEKENRQLAQSVENLKRITEERKSIIQLQKNVIRLLDDTRSTIENSLEEQIKSHEIEIEDIENKLKLVLTNKILFDSGTAEISTEGKAVLLKIANSLGRNNTQHIIVEGHTDNLPIAPPLKKRYPTNWELSTARATAVVRFLQEETELESQKFSVSGYSHYRPVASNETEEGRRQNRRIEIIVDPSKPETE